MLNAYNGKTDIIFTYLSKQEVNYDYRNAVQQRQMIIDQFTGKGWRTDELLEKVDCAGNFYFDKFCGIKALSAGAKEKSFRTDRLIRGLIIAFIRSFSHAWHIFRFVPSR